MIKYWDGLFFALFWTAAMYRWNPPLDLVPTLILIVAGALGGVLFHLGMRRYLSFIKRRSA
jgi:hypothetical protein